MSFGRRSRCFVFKLDIIFQLAYIYTYTLLIYAILIFVAQFKCGITGLGPALPFGVLITCACIEDKIIKFILIIIR